MIFLKRKTNSNRRRRCFYGEGEGSFMNLVDSSGWMEYFVNGPQSHFFAEPLKDVPHLIVPTICFYEVFKKTLLMCNEEKAFEVVAAMGQGQVIPTHTHTHFSPL